MKPQTKQWAKRIFGVLLVVVVCSAAIAEQTIRSPWSDTPVKLTDVAAPCPTQAAFPADLNTDGFYRLDDASHSVIDPARMKAYEESSGPIKDAVKQIISLADRYRTTGSRQAAQCTLTLLGQMAQNRTMTGHMSSSQAYYVQGWLGGAMAIAYLKVRDSGLNNPQQAQAISGWLTKIALATRDWYDAAAQRHPQGNNHLYWAGAELAAVAAVADRKDLLDWAIHAYKNGVDQIEPDGTLPLEMARGARALHYHLYALAPLVFIAEMAEGNGIDLYAFRGHALARLVNVCLLGLRDPAFFATRAHAQQEVPATPKGDDAYWAVPYSYRFPSPALTALVANAPTLSSLYLGGLPPA